MLHHPRDEWMRRLEAVDVPFAPIHRINQVVADSQVVAMDAFGAFDQPEAGHRRVVRYPVRVDGARPCAARLPALAPGERPEETLVTYRRPLDMDAMSSRDGSQRSALRRGSRLSMGKMLAAMLATAVLCGPVRAQLVGEAVRIGVLNNMTGGLSAPAGPGSVVAAEMAIEDFGGAVLGKPIELRSADELNKPDVGLQIARRWFDDGVDMIVDLPNTAVALAVQKLARDRNRIAIVTTGAGSTLTGIDCTPNSMAWVYNSRALADVLGSALVSRGGDSWFLLSTDYTFGRTMEADLRSVLARQRAKMVDVVAAPQETTDFSSYLVQAQASGAKVVGLANVASDTVNSIKQAHEFGLVAGGQKLAALVATITDVHALGLEMGGGLYLATAFYWDRTPETRAWSQRFFARHHAMPTMMQAGVYSAVSHYLRSVAAAGTDAAGPVLAQMRATPVHDMFADDGHIRPDGLMVHPMYLAQVKSPAESKGAWDYYKIIATVPAAEAFGPLSDSKCPLVNP